MELSKGLINNLVSIGINPNALSEKEKRFLSQIHDFFIGYKKQSEELSNILAKNKFNRTTIAASVECSRQTLYKNPTISAYIDWCEKQADDIYEKVVPVNVVPKEKYDTLKDENQKLLINIIDVANKDAEIERLAKENQELRNRIDKLMLRLEQSQKQSSATVIHFKKNSTH